MVSENKITMRTVGDDAFIYDSEGNGLKLYGDGSIKDSMPEIDPPIEPTAQSHEQTNRTGSKDIKQPKGVRNKQISVSPPPIPPGSQSVDPAIFVRGYGAFKGIIDLNQGIDWNKPIYVQVSPTSTNGAEHRKAKNLRTPEQKRSIRCETA